MRELRANTQVKVVIGPAVAVGDGFTPVTTLALSTADEAELMKHDASAVTSISGNTIAAITSMDGYYNVTLTTTDTNTPGMLLLAVNDDSLILPLKEEFMVLTEGAYDSKYLPSRIAGATSGTPTTTSSNTDLTGYADDELIGRTIIFISGTAAGQASDITDYASTSGVVTYTGITTAPAASDKFIIV